MIRKYAEIFCWKMWVAFAVQKLLTFFSAKNIRILYIESAKTVNEMTLNKLVKLMAFWTTGPRYLWEIQYQSFSFISKKALRDLLKFYIEVVLWFQTRLPTSYHCFPLEGGGWDTPGIRHQNHAQPMGNWQNTLTHRLGIKREILLCKFLMPTQGIFYTTVTYM